MNSTDIERLDRTRTPNPEQIAGSTARRSQPALLAQRTLDDAIRPARMIK